MRDALLGLEPKDYDIATDATPDDVTRLFRGARAVGEAFGVMLVRTRLELDDQVVITEVATFRTDADYQDGRRPSQVQFTDARHDALRRDFTVNALFQDPFAQQPLLTVDPDQAATPKQISSDRLVGIIDYVGGVADLEAGIIRAVGDAQERLSEDYLRMLRAVRFAARFGFSVEPLTAAAIIANARHLGRISRERIGQELTWMLAHPTAPPVEAATLLQRMHLDGPALNEDTADPPLATLSAISPGATLAEALAAWMLDRHLLTDPATPDPAAPEPAANRTRTNDGGGNGLDVTLQPLRHRVERFVETSSPRLIARWRKALCLTNDTSTALREILRLLPRAMDWLNLDVAGRKRLLAAHFWRESRTVLAAMSHGPGMTALMTLIYKDATELAKTGIAPDPLLTGDDLIALGAKPGPTFRRLLDKAYDLQLDSRLMDRPAALTWLKNQIAQTE